MRPVFIAGRGAVSAFGLGRAAWIEGVFSGRRAVVARARTAGYRVSCPVAAEFPADCFAAHLVERDLALESAACAGAEALTEARVGDPSSLGLVLATTKAELSGLDAEGDGLGLAARLARRLALRLETGPVAAAVSTACASGLSALALAERRIALGECERLLVVGVDVLCEFVLSGFGSMHLLDPEPCRPFDAQRRGLSLGEGAGAILLSCHRAESIGVRIAGHGGANDAWHVTGCDRTGRGLTLAVRRALDHARIAAHEIDVIHLHGTGTLANDASEAVGLAAAFEGRTPPAFGTKAQSGHTLGASGVLESLLAIAALERCLAPSNVGLEETDVDARLELVRAAQPLARAGRALKVARGFGGVQQAIVFEA